MLVQIMCIIMCIMCNRRWNAENEKENEFQYHHFDSTIFEPVKELFLDYYQKQCGSLPVHGKLIQSLMFHTKIRQNREIYNFLPVERNQALASIPNYREDYFLQLHHWHHLHVLVPRASRPRVGRLWSFLQNCSFGNFCENDKKRSWECIFVNCSI